METSHTRRCALGAWRSKDLQTSRLQKEVQEDKTETFAYEGLGPTWLRRRPYAPPERKKIPTKEDFLVLEGKPRFEGKRGTKGKGWATPHSLGDKKELTEENDLWEDQKILSRDPRFSWGKKA